ncbi:MAG TPA: matrixin family metalloprotease [Phycisphaerales bacterium]|nr:matrixin family metalloprotease [Phycisphaerales bacterium]
MTTSYTRGFAPFILLALAGIATPALAGPLEHAPVDFNAFDVSFQDGRTHSQIRGPMVVNKVLGILESGDPDDRGPIAACFADGTSPEVMAAVNAAMADGYQSRYQIGTRWSVGNPGDRLQITWSFAPDGLSIPANGQIPSEATSPNILFQRMDQLFSGLGGRTTWVTQFENSFARWEALTGLTYTRVRMGANDWDDGAAWGTGSGTNRGMVRIAMHPIDNNSNVLAYNSFPDNGDMVMDSAENWNSPGGTYLFLRNVIMHEHGHGLGLAHVCPMNSTKLMEPLLATNFDGPQLDEIRAGHESYGDALEPNNNAAGATDLGALVPGQNLILGNVPAPTVTNAATLSLDAFGEVDWFKFTVEDPRLVDITLTPHGTTYLDGQQNANGSCSAGANENALAATDLLLTVFKSNGTTVLRTNNESAAGLVESISGLMVANGTTYVRVSQAGPLATVQLYKLNISVRSTNLTPSATDGTFSDKVRVTWSSIPDATAYQVYRNTSNATFGGTNVSPSLPAGTTSFEDTTANPGTTYYYFLKVIQPDDPNFRFTSTDGDTGRRNALPTANAGPDQTVVDTDNSGSEAVTLNASASSDSDGSLTIYRWQEGFTTLAQTSSPTSNVNLTQGSHTITLTVFDNNSGISTDTVVVDVVPPGGGCPGDECGPQDFNGDGDSGTDQDIEAFFSCLGGNCCESCFCQGADFNGDGDTGTDQDIEAFFRVLGGGTC